MRRIQAWGIVRDDDWLALGLFSMIASTVVGLVQLLRLVNGGRSQAKGDY